MHGVEILLRRCICKSLCNGLRARSWYTLAGSDARNRRSSHSTPKQHVWIHKNGRVSTYLAVFPHSYLQYHSERDEQRNSATSDRLGAAPQAHRHTHPHHTVRSSMLIVYLVFLDAGTLLDAGITILADFSNPNHNVMDVSFSYLQPDLHHQRRAESMLKSVDVVSIRRWPRLGRTGWPPTAWHWRRWLTCGVWRISFVPLEAVRRLPVHIRFESNQDRFREINLSHHQIDCVKLCGSFRIGDASEPNCARHRLLSCPNPPNTPSVAIVLNGVGPCFKTWTVR